MFVIDIFNELGGPCEPVGAVSLEAFGAHDAVPSVCRLLCHTAHIGLQLEPSYGDVMFVTSSLDFKPLEKQQSIRGCLLYSIMTHLKLNLPVEK